MSVLSQRAKQPEPGPRLGASTLAVAVSLGAALLSSAATVAAEPESRSPAKQPGAQTPGAQTSGATTYAAYTPETEVDISGPYHAWIDGEQFPSTLDIWGPKATLKIAIDGRDKPMQGTFVRNRLGVLSKYGAENFNLTTAVVADYDGWNFTGQYRRIDEKLGAKIAGIILTPTWHGGGGGAPVKMPLPRKMSDVPGRYGLTIAKDGRTVYDVAEVEVDQGTVKLDAGGRRYVCDFSDQEMFPLFWEGNRMDTFRLEPTESGFKGTLVKEVGKQKEVFEVELAKGKGGGGGDDRRWTYVYDAVIANSPPVYIAKLTLHEDEATLVMDIKGRKATMVGSLADGVLSGTGKYGGTTISIRALKNPGGFAGAFRKGDGALVKEYPVVLKNRPARTATPSW